MFILNNINDIDYKKYYPNLNNVRFDISEKQLSSKKNIEWNEIKIGDIVCVVKSSRKINTFIKVTNKYGLGDNDLEFGESFVLIGDVVAKLEPAQDMQLLLNKYKVEHKYLPNNNFSIGFNVANLKQALDSLLVTTRRGQVTLVDL